MGEVETPLEKPVKYLYELKLIGDPNLSSNPAAKISAEIEKHQARYHKEKVYYRISNFNIKTGGWGCGWNAAKPSTKPHGKVADVIHETAQYATLNRK